MTIGGENLIVKTVTKIWSLLHIFFVSNIDVASTTLAEWWTTYFFGPKKLDLELQSIDDVVQTVAIYSETTTISHSLESFSETSSQISFDQFSCSSPARNEKTDSILAGSCSNHVSHWSFFEEFYSQMFFLTHLTNLNWFQGTIWIGFGLRMGKVFTVHSGATLFPCTSLNSCHLLSCDRNYWSCDNVYKFH